MSGGSDDKGKGKAERHSTRKGAGSIDKLTYTKPGTNKGTRMALGGAAGTTIVVSSDEEYEDDRLNTGTHPDLPSVPIGVPFTSATGEGKRFIFADNEEEDVAAPTVAVAAPTVAVAAPTVAVAAPTTAVVQPGLVRERVAALQSAALGLAAMAAHPPLPAPVVAVREQEVQTDPLVFPFVFPPKGKWTL
jgi:hypothetical protein